MSDGNGSTDARYREYWLKQEEEHDRAREQERRLDGVIAQLANFRDSVESRLDKLTTLCADVLRAVQTGNETMGRFMAAVNETEKRVAALEESAVTPIETARARAKKRK